MEISHLLYKVRNLNKSVDFFIKKGFNVEFGKDKNPYNALIYFLDGKYIELIENMNMSILAKVFLTMIGRRKFVCSLSKQEKANEGFIRMAMHIEENQVDYIKKLYKSEFQENAFSVTVKRKDIHGNNLTCKCVFPNDSKLPFFNTKLLGGNNIWEVEHPNKVLGIKKIIYGASDKEYNFLKKICTDKAMKIDNSGEGIKFIDFYYDDKNISNKILYKNGWVIEDDDYKS